MGFKTYYAIIKSGLRSGTKLCPVGLSAYAGDGKYFTYDHGQWKSDPKISAVFGRDDVLVVQIGENEANAAIRNIDLRSEQEL